MTYKLRTLDQAKSDARLAINGGNPLVKEGHKPESLVNKDALLQKVMNMFENEGTFVWYGGPQQQSFERKFAELVGAREAVLLASGTGALHVALHAVGAGPGRVVAFPHFGFHAIADAALLTGAKPFVMAVDQKTLVLDLEKAVRDVPNGAIVVAVHACGRAADVEELQRLRPDLVLVEDAADAQGTLFRGEPVGRHGRAAIWSFTTAHNEVHTAGVAGMLTTNDPELAGRARRLVHYGKDHERVTPGTRLNPQPVESGFNYMSTEIEAAVGAATASTAISAWARRRAAGVALERRLRKMGFEIPESPAECEQNFYDVMFALPESWRRDRDWVLDALVAEGAPAWTYNSMLAFPWFQHELQSRGAWGMREEAMREAESVPSTYMGIRPSVTPEGVRAVAAACSKLFYGNALSLQAGVDRAA